LTQINKNNGLINKYPIDFVKHIYPEQNSQPSSRSDGRAAGSDAAEPGDSRRGPRRALDRSVRA
jgi:hypothetical protein